MSSPIASIQLRNDDLTWRQVDGEVVVLDQRSWNYISIHGSGAMLWPLLVAGSTKRELVDALVRAFEIDLQRARADVAAFLADLDAHDLIATVAD